MNSANGYPLSVENRDWIADSPVTVSEGDVECFSEYMELWIHRARIEGLRLWLSGMMRIQVSLASLDQLNQQLAACGFALHKDPDKNYIFRVMYSGCFVQLQHGSYVMELNLLKRIHRFAGRSHNYVMKCPTAISLPNREHIKCDPAFIQVTREIPLDSWNKELQWSLALRGNLVVALEDASLIQVNVERRQSNITVQGRRREILRPILIMETKGEFLPLKLVSGHYAYSMEATCPDVSRSVTEKTVLHIFKRRMGLTKRGGNKNETLTISSVVVHQTDMFTWTENSDFVQLVIPTSAIQHKKSCAEEVGKEFLQPFFRVDVVLSFKETNHKMHWTMENTLPCMRSRPALVESQHSSTPEFPLTVFPTQSIVTVHLHPKLLSLDGMFTETFPKGTPSLTKATAAPVSPGVLSFSTNRGKSKTL
ncbi:ciliated left-right organizer protein containing ZP-N domains homolog [Alosa pseudoharengus]|uniref:ciliated left-right organizer protein containing ZP-N domains homolog n=1 Tax=Alosa pseudoharengus TaxID=34774 RepID=UPI003F8C648B